MQESYKKALGYVLLSEGGNVDDPHDHGGRTSRGITQRVYDAWREEQGKGRGDVFLATDDEIAAIYKEEYWDPLGDMLPAGIDYMYFDMAVNAGPGRAAKLLQRAVGVNEDGRLGPVSRQAILKADPRALISTYTSVKDGFYRGLGQPRFLRGWLNRNADVKKRALGFLS